MYASMYGALAHYVLAYRFERARPTRTNHRGVGGELHGWGRRQPIEWYISNEHDWFQAAQTHPYIRYRFWVVGSSMAQTH